MVFFIFLSYTKSTNVGMFSIDQRNKAISIRKKTLKQINPSTMRRIKEMKEEPKIQSTRNPRHSRIGEYKKIKLEEAFTHYLT